MTDAARRGSIDVSVVAVKTPSKGAGSSLDVVTKVCTCLMPPAPLPPGLVAQPQPFPGASHLQAACSMFPER